MRLLMLALCLLSVVIPGLTAAPPARAAECQFVLGFAALREAISDIVGKCLVDQHHDATTGDGFQETTAWHGKGGLLYWRKADNWTGFTDGYRTWTAGPNGIEQRLNTERFAWEPDRLVATLRNAEYRLPIGPDPRSISAETVFRLTEGFWENRERRQNVRLVEGVSASGDLDGDGVPDAVALLALNAGGSGTFEYAVAVLDRGGQPVQAGHEFLGDRVRVNRFTIANRQVAVDMIAHGPTEPLCCPTQRVVKTLSLSVQVPSAGQPAIGGAAAPGR